jgi:hypothetical protein
MVMTVQVTNRQLGQAPLPEEGTEVVAGHHPVVGPRGGFDAGALQREPLVEVGVQRQGVVGHALHADVSASPRGIELKLPGEIVSRLPLDEPFE